jgi:E1A/CREB-binding protein
LVYQEILLTYFEYIKRKGYESVHIWVCPPIATASQDYLFYCHPEEQKIPDLGRLQAWYGKLLQKAKDTGVIISYQVKYSLILFYHYIII